MLSGQTWAPGILSSEFWMTWSRTEVAGQPITSPQGLFVPYPP